MIGSELHSPGYHTTVPDGEWVHRTRDSLGYATALLHSGQPEYVKRAGDIIKKVIGLQDQDPLSRTYGIWPWLLEEPLDQMSPPDWNWADFCGKQIGHMLIDYEDLLPDDLSQTMRESLGHAAWSIFRRNVTIGYTNIAIMGAGVALIAGQVLDSPRLTDYGRRKLSRVLEYTRHHGGFQEYNSPTYTRVALSETERVLHLVRDPQAREDAEALRRIAWETIANYYHPATKQWAGPHSRAYSDKLEPGTAQYISDRVGFNVGIEPLKPSFYAIPPIPCPDDLIDRFKTLPAEEIEVRSSFLRTAPLTYEGTTWFKDDACLGTINNDTFWVQRRVLLGYWRTDDDPAVVLRLRFLHDGVDFASAAVYNAQEKNRVLSVLGILLGFGDFHVSLDRPADGIFHAEDFRVRYELSGEGVEVRDLGGGKFELSAGNYRAAICTAPGHFGPYDVKWEIGKEDGKAFLDGICYSGERRAFDLSELGEVAVAAGLEILKDDEGPMDEAVHITVEGDLTGVDWGPFKIGAPSRPVPPPLSSDRFG
jgi:hypothetical protein